MVKQQQPQNERRRRLDAPVFVTRPSPSTRPRPRLNEEDRRVRALMSFLRGTWCYRGLAALLRERFPRATSVQATRLAWQLGNWHIACHGSYDARQMVEKLQALPY